MPKEDLTQEQNSEKEVKAMSNTVNGILNAGMPSMLKTRTSSRIRKAPVTKKEFFMVKSTGHTQSGKSIFSLNKESSKNFSKAALHVYHQNIQGLHAKVMSYSISYI
jgi:hypothetical protein